MTEPDRPLSCEEVQRTIQEALGVPDLPAVARHLEECAACAAEAETLAHFTQALRSLPLVEPSQGFWGDLTQKILERVRGNRRRPFRAGALVAALLLFAIIPADRVRWSPRSVERWLGEIAVTDPGLDPFEGLRSSEEAALLVHSVAVASDLGPQVIQQLIQVTEEEAVRRGNAVVWNLLDALDPQELGQVLARVEKGEGR